MSNGLWGIAGAAIGSVFGMPALGFAVGSGAGAALGGGVCQGSCRVNF